jgi:uncharacterized tellurite resistance protein B-like protein
LSLLRFLGIGAKAAGRDVEPASLIELGAQLETLPPEESRFVAAFAYTLARIAGADLRTDDAERAEIARHLEAFGGIEATQAAVLADSAVRIADTHSPSDDHLVARAFRDMTESPERLRLLRCLYAVAAADETISTREDNEIFEVATAIGVARERVVALRSEYKQYLGTMKALPTER